ncbi:hypothetical protein [Paenibacillus senegalimassiliensis]|uniref:hypothetical protein n=1 Tax=Paenibacillus senegalimassiliensis TaxID=1737426 RepID=UPI000AA59131|nr:hypothetical protein [Paenibacillus senegalimassiliensis]
MEINEVMQPGVTGFSVTSENWGEQNNKEFEVYLFEAIRSNNGECIKKELLTNNGSFYTYHIYNRTENFYILFHSIYPFVAYASVVNISGIKFIDEPESMRSTFNERYKVLPKEQLEQTLLKDHIKTLTKYEQKMIKYWGPGTIGEVIYNYWD